MPIEGISDALWMRALGEGIGDAFRVGNGDMCWDNLALWDGATHVGWCHT